MPNMRERIELRIAEVGEQIEKIDKKRDEYMRRGEFLPVSFEEDELVDRWNSLNSILEEMDGDDYPTGRQWYSE